MAKVDNPYLIALARLKEGRHSFEFALDDAFLTLAPELEGAEPLAQGASVTAAVVLDKSPRLLDVHITLSGQLTLACDRCLQDYPQAVTADYRIVFSHDRSVEAPERGGDAGDDDVRYLPAGAPELDLRHELYELLLLQVPHRRIPPDCPGPRCPAQVLALLEAGARAQAEGPPPDDDDSAPTDPRWAALKGLRDSE